jgi:hypothetical protein
VLVIRSVGSHSVFEVHLGKRGRRAGLVDANGKPNYSFYIKHASTGICWETASADDFEAKGKTPAKTADDVLGLIPPTGDISQTKLFIAAETTGIGKQRIRDFLKVLIEAKRVFEWRTKRPGTNAAKSYSRKPQELIK